MTEHEWLTSTSPLGMLRHVRSRLSDRKLRLLSCGCARLVWDVLTADQRAVVDAVERHTDGEATDAVYHTIVSAASRNLTEVYQDETQTDVTHEKAIWRVIYALVCTPTDDGTRGAIEWVAASFARRPPSSERMATQQQVRQRVCELIREVAGNPFRERVAAQSTGTAAPWMLRVNETAHALAVGIQATQAYDRMPILADALEDDGCADTELLNHLREGRTHVRGCWALDLVLGKS